MKLALSALVVMLSASPVFGAGTLVCSNDKIYYVETDLSSGRPRAGEIIATRALSIDGELVQKVTQRFGVTTNAVAPYEVAFDDESQKIITSYLDGADQITIYRSRVVVSSMRSQDFKTLNEEVLCDQHMRMVTHRADF